MSTWKSEYTHQNFFSRCPIEVKLKDALQGPAKLICADVEESMSSDEDCDWQDISVIDSDSDIDSDQDYDFQMSKKPADFATSTVTGGFRKDLFTKYVEDISSKKCLTLSVEKLVALRAACVLSQHAQERKHERYAERMQEFLRSLTTTHDCLAVKNRRYFLFLDSKRVEISSSYSVLHVTENPTGTRGRHYRRAKPLNLSAVQRLTESARRWNQRIASGRDRWLVHFELPLTDQEMASLATAAERPFVAENVKVFSTTTTFVASANFKKIITCYPTRRSYRYWLKRSKAKLVQVGFCGRKRSYYIDYDDVFEYYAYAPATNKISVLPSPPAEAEADASSPRTVHVPVPTSSPRRHHTASPSLPREEELIPSPSSSSLSSSSSSSRRSYLATLIGSSGLSSLPVPETTTMSALAEAEAEAEETESTATELRSPVSQPPEVVARVASESTVVVTTPSVPVPVTAALEGTLGSRPHMVNDEDVGVEEPPPSTVAAMVKSTESRDTDDASTWAIWTPDRWIGLFITLLLMVAVTLLFVVA